MRYAILGSLEVWDGVRRVAVGGRREQRILAALLLAAGHTVSIGALVGAVWDEEPPPTADKQVRNAVSRLRVVLAAQPDAVARDGSGYRVTPTAGALDAEVFDTAVREARAAARVGDRRTAAALLEEALDLWRGPALAGLGGRVIEAAATAWNERRLAVRETYFDHALELGRHAELVPDLSAALAEQPLRDKPLAQLMLALHRCGRQADALSRYCTARTRMAEELGLEPGAELQSLHRRILLDDPGLRGPADDGLPGEVRSSDPVPVVGRRSEPVPVVARRSEASLSHRSRHVVPRQLPAPVRVLVGRTSEVGALHELADRAADLLDGTAVCAVTGAAGIGKTALAIWWAHRASSRFPDGQLYLNLRGFDPARRPMQPAEAIGVLLDAVGGGERRPPSAEGQAALYRSLLTDKRILLLLDDSRDGEQVAPLLPGGAHCAVVITSRMRLEGLAVKHGALRLGLDTLSADEARELLTGRLAAEPEATEVLLDCCAGQPLALGIVAARAAGRPDFPLAALARELAEPAGRLDALDAADAGAGFRSALSQSYYALHPAAAALFDLLGLLAEPEFDSADAAGLSAVPLSRARVLLHALENAHLLAQPSPDRYLMHELVHLYAVDRARRRWARRGYSPSLAALSALGRRFSPGVRTAAPYRPAAGRRR
jgi:DNA-binding SARP family transcriptional activator